MATEVKVELPDSVVEKIKKRLKGTDKTVSDLVIDSIVEMLEQKEESEPELDLKPVPEKEPEPPFIALTEEESEKDYISISEALRIFPRLRRGTIYNWLDKKRLVRYKVVGKIFINKKQFMNLIRSGGVPIGGKND